eukprot:2336763-Amphidinium_carterae.2
MSQPAVRSSAESTVLARCSTQVTSTSSLSQDSKEPEEEPVLPLSSLARSVSTSSRPSNSSSQRLPVRLPVQALLSGELFIPYDGVLYVVWALEDSPLGARRFAGLHFGVRPWEGVVSLTRAKQYLAGTHRLQRVRIAPSENQTTFLSTLIWSGVTIYEAESARHRARRQSYLWEWR